MTYFELENKYKKLVSEIKGVANMELIEEQKQEEINDVKRTADMSNITGYGISYINTKYMAIDNKYKRITNAAIEQSFVEQFTKIQEDFKVDLVEVSSLSREDARRILGKALNTVINREEFSYNLFISRVQVEFESLERMVLDLKGYNKDYKAKWVQKHDERYDSAYVREVRK